MVFGVGISAPFPDHCLLLPFYTTFYYFGHMYRQNRCTTNFPSNSIVRVSIATSEDWLSKKYIREVFFSYEYFLYLILFSNAETSNGRMYIHVALSVDTFAVACIKGY